MGKVDPCHFNTVVVLIVAACYMCHLGFPTGYGNFARDVCDVGTFILCFFVELLRWSSLPSVPGHFMNFLLLILGCFALC